MSDQKNASQILRSHALHIPLIIIGIVAAVALGQSTIVAEVAHSGLVGMFVAVLIFGAMYSSILTVAPATVGLVELAHAGVPIPLLALVGGFGATLSDISLFQIIKFGFIDELIAYFQRHSQGAFNRLFKIKLFKFLLVVIGALSIATPIPDEIGLAMMGIGRAKIRTVALVGFVFNTLGIMTIGLLAR